MNVDFAERAKAIRRQILALELPRSPRVALLIAAEDASGRRVLHREPIDIAIPDSVCAVSQFAPCGNPSAMQHLAAIDTPDHRERMRRSVEALVLRAAADLVARGVANLPAEADGLRFVDAGLEVVYAA